MASDRSPTLPRGVKLLHDPARNKGTAFTTEERRPLGQRVLLPPTPVTLPDQGRRVMQNFRSKSSDLERYVALMATQDRNEVLFYRVLLDNLE